MGQRGERQRGDELHSYLSCLQKRRARNGRPGPVLIEIPGDMWNQEVPGEIKEVGVFRPGMEKVESLGPGDVGYVAVRLMPERSCNNSSRA